MHKNITSLLKTTAALAALFAGSQTWAATSYAAGSEYGDTRVDTVLCSGDGTFNGATAPGATVKKLMVNISTNGTPELATGASTTLTKYPSTVKEIWFRGEARGLDTVLGTAGANGVSAKGLPCPSAGSVVHFDLSTSPSAADTSWFSAAPSGIIIVLERGSANPQLPDSYYASAEKVVLGMSITLNTLITVNAMLERHQQVREIDAVSLAKVTTAGASTFNKKVKGISLAGGHAITCKDDCEFVDIAAPSAITIADRKKVTVKGVSAAPVFPASTAITRGSGSKFEIKD